MATRFEEIQIEQIRANAANIREDLGDMEQLTSDVKTMGIKTPIIVYPHPDIEGDYLVQEGHRRRQAAIAAGLSSMPCVIVDPPKRGKREDLEVMLTTGRNHKTLTESEVNHGIQQLLDLGMDVTTIGKKFKMKRTEISTRAKLTTAPESIRKRFDSGALDLVSVAKIQELEKSGSEGLLDTIVAELDGNPHANAGNPHGLDRSLERAKTIHASTAEVSKLTGLGSVEAPRDANYSGLYVRADAALTEDEHIAAGHEFQRGRYDDSTLWFEKRKGSKAAPASDAEKAEKQKQRHLNGLLGIAFRARQSFLAAKVRDRDGVSADLDFEMLWDYVRSDVMRLAPEFLADVTGIGYPEDASTGYGEGGYQIHKQWEEKVEKRLQTFSWRQIVRLASLFGTKDTDKQLRFARSFDRKGHSNAYDWVARFRWLEKVQRVFGYELDSAEVEAVEWAKDTAGQDRAKECDLDTVTEACCDCRQSVVGGEGWDGRCGDCADRAEAVSEGAED